MSNIGSGTVAIDHSLDGESQVTWILSIVSLACIISATAVIARLVTRLRILRIFGPDDALMGLAQIIAIGAALSIGLGEFHNHEVSPRGKPDQEDCPGQSVLVFPALS